MRKQIKKYEIELFDEIAVSENYETAPEEFYQYIIKTLRQQKIPLRGLTLEAGCGSGAFGHKIKLSNPKMNIIGVDISSQMVKRANKRKNDYKAIQGDLENKKLFKKNKFNLIFCALVLHHFPDLEEVFANFQFWAKKGSHIIIIEPNSTNLIGMISKVSRQIFELVFGKDYLVDQKFATPNEIDHSVATYKRLLNKYGFTDLKIDSGYIQPKIPITLSLGGVKAVLTDLLRVIIPVSFLTNNFVLITARKS